MAADTLTIKIGVNAAEYAVAIHADEVPIALKRLIGDRPPPPRDPVTGERPTETDAGRAKAIAAEIFRLCLDLDPENQDSPPSVGCSRWDKMHAALGLSAEAAKGIGTAELMARYRKLSATAKADFAGVA